MHSTRLGHVGLFALVAACAAESTPSQPDATATRTPDATTARGPDAAATRPLDHLLRLDHIQVRGTHNSYHIEPDLVFHASHAYTHQPLDVQLQDQGVRAFEIDIHKDSASSDELTVYHIFGVDPKTTCMKLSDCLATIDHWSIAHPMHVPISVWIEVKDDTGGTSIDDLDIFDEAVRSVFSEARLITPDLVQGDYGSPRQRIETEGWPTLGEVRGKIMFIILSGGNHGEAYTSGWTTLEGRVAFQRASADQYGLGWAVVTKINDPTASADIAAAIDARMLVASNFCAADDSDDSCRSALPIGIGNGVHHMKDDVPAQIPGRAYWMDLPEGNPVLCNAVTAPAECSAVALEDL